MIRFRFLFPVFAPVALVACGGGGGSDPVAAPAPLVSGVFIGPPVEGLRYETASQDGLTDADGTFAYRKGEKVRFYAGDILLGEARGAEEMTLFNLVGIESPPVTATEVRAAINLKKSFTNVPTPLEVAANLATFLESIDADAEAANGIVIPDKIEQLAAGRSLNFVQRWHHFREYYPFLKLMGDAHDNVAWATLPERRISDTSQALDAVYASLGLVPEIYFESEVLKDPGNDGSISTRIARDYNVSTGSLTYVLEDTGNDGNSDLSDSYDFLGSGQLQRHDRFTGGSLTWRTDNSYSQRGFMTESETDYYGAASALKTTYTRNSYGQLLASATDIDIDGSINNKTTFQYNVHGLLIREETDAGNTGTINITSTYAYDGNGYRTLYEYDGNATDSDIDIQVRYTNDANGLVLTITRDSNGDGIDDLYYETDYLPNGQPARMRQELNSGSLSIDGVVDRLRKYRYDANGHLLESSIDFVDEGETREINKYTRDALGNVLVHTFDLDGDGTPDFRSTTTYDLNGNRTREERDTDGDNIIDYAETVTNKKITRWGPVFNPLYP